MRLPFLIIPALTFLQQTNVALYALANRLIVVIPLDSKWLCTSHAYFKDCRLAKRELFVDQRRDEFWTA